MYSIIDVRLSVPINLFLPVFVTALTYVITLFSEMSIIIQ